MVERRTPMATTAGWLESRTRLDTFIEIGMCVAQRQIVELI